MVCTGWWMSDHFGVNSQIANPEVENEAERSLLEGLIKCANLHAARETISPSPRQAIRGSRRHRVFDVRIDSDYRKFAPAVELGSTVEVIVTTGCGREGALQSMPGLAIVAAASPEFLYSAHNANGQDPVEAVNRTVAHLWGRRSLAQTSSRRWLAIWSRSSRRD